MKLFSLKCYKPVLFLYSSSYGQCVFLFNFVDVFQLLLASVNKQLQLDDKKSSSASTSKQTHPTLENGSAVELGKPPDMQYGVIRWIRSIDGEDKAYVEMVSQIFIATYVHTV